MQGVQSLTPIMNRKKHWQQLSVQKGLQRPKAADDEWLLDAETTALVKPNVPRRCIATAYTAAKFARQIKTLNMGAGILSAYMLASVSGIKQILGKMRGSSEDWKLSIV